MSGARNYRLADAYRESGMSMSRIAAEVGTSRSRLHDYANGMRPSVCRAIRIAKVLGKSVEDLWEEESDGEAAA